MGYRIDLYTVCKRRDYAYVIPQSQNSYAKLQLSCVSNTLTFLWSCDAASTCRYSQLLIALQPQEGRDQLKRARGCFYIEAGCIPLSTEG